MAISASTLKKAGQVSRIVALCLVGVIGALLLTYIIYFMFAWSPSRLVAEKPPTSAEQVTFVNERLKNAVQLFTGMFFVVTAIFSYRTVKATERNTETANENARIAAENLRVAQEKLEQDKRITDTTLKITEAKQASDRFVKATENLDSEKMSTRIGAIYSLESIARDSEADHRVVFEVLSSYLVETTKDVGVKETSPILEQVATPNAFKLRADIQAIITVIGRRDAEKDKGQRISLRYSFLPCATFINYDNTDDESSKPNFRRVVFTDCCLAKAAAMFCDFEGANFVSADLENANFAMSNCRDARFTHAKLTGVNFLGADLTNADLRGVDLSRSRFLSQEQVNSARVSDVTEFPKGIIHPVRSKPPVSS